MASSAEIAHQPTALTVLRVMTSGHAADRQIHDSFIQWLPPKWAAVVRRPETEVSTAQAAEIEGRFDRFIIFKAGRQGFEIFKSPSVLKRVSEWQYGVDQGGFQLIKDLTTALNHSADIRRRDSKQKGVIKGAFWWKIKQVWKDELQALQRQARALSLSSWPEVETLIRREYRRTKGKSYKKLFQNVQNDSLPTFAITPHGESAVADFLTGDIKAAGFFDLLVSHTENLEPTTVRKNISNAGRSKE